MKQDHPGEGRSANANPTKIRAQRDDAGKARAQQRGTPKTHPTRAPGANRKERKGVRRTD